MANPVVHFEVTGKNAKKLQDFYKKAFGWSLQDAGNDYALVETGEDDKIRGGIGKAQLGEGCATFYVGVTDIEAAFRTIEGLGGRKLVEPYDVPGGPTIAFFADPEEHVIGLVKVP